MPNYNYKNVETGEEWTEFRPMAEADDGVDGVKIIRTLCTPNILGGDTGDAWKKASKFQQNILNPIMKSHTGADMKSKL